MFNEKCTFCIDLQKTWYKALESNSFIDIEAKKHHTSVSEVLGLKDFQTQDTYTAKVDYYSWARSKANEGKFENKKDKLIWQLHSKGLSTRKISPEVKLEFSWISRKILKIENYLKTQMESMTTGSMSFAYG